MVIFVTGIAQCRAGTITWTNTAGGNWSASTNWSANQVPVSGDNVVITNAGTYIFTNLSPSMPFQFTNNVTFTNRFFRVRLAP